MLGVLAQENIGFGLTILPPSAFKMPGNPSGLPGFFHATIHPKLPDQNCFAPLKQKLGLQSKEKCRRHPWWLSRRFDDAMRPNCCFRGNVFLRQRAFQRPFFLPHKQAARFYSKAKPEFSALAKGENTAGRMPCAQTKAPSPCVGEGAFYAAAFTPLPNRTAGYIPLWRCFFPAYSRLSGQGARPRSPRCGIRRWKCGAKAPCAAPRGKMGCTGSWR